MIRCLRNYYQKKMTNKLHKYELQIRDSPISRNMHLPTGKKGDIEDPKNTLYSVHQRGNKKHYGI